MGLVLVALAALPAGAHDRPPVERDTWYLPTADHVAQLFVEELGPRSAPPVIVLHGGWGAEHSYLDDVVLPQVGPAHRFVLYDQRGSLLSPVPDTSSLSVRQQIEDLELLRETLGEERLTIFAHSQGTYLALAYAQAHPDHVRSLILTGTVVGKSPEGGDDAYMAQTTATAHELIARTAVQREMERVRSTEPDGPRRATHLWRIQFAAVNLFHVERWRGMPGGRAFYNQASADAISATQPRIHDFEPLLLSGRFAVSLINGDHDYLDPGERYWRGMVARDPRLHLTVLRDAEHSAWIDAPASFQSAFAAALAR
ncbi:alpha/beta fold hydrolase [Sphingomonas sp. CROZ-RG-20F-R02-07]|uniref:alpha/beta fold hydrolase n=1 Tax=Sphingomonas sp. CROZ-RG-20F-R02-07 TaxID=2914832 RepID=UPI001F55C35C